MAARDLGPLGREVPDLIGWPVLLWAVQSGENDFPQRERVTTLQVCVRGAVGTAKWGRFTAQFELGSTASR